MGPVAREKLLNGATLLAARKLGMASVRRAWYTAHSTGPERVLLKDTLYILASELAGGYDDLDPRRLVSPSKYTRREDGSLPEPAFAALQERSEWWCQPPQLRWLQELGLLEGHR